MKSFVIRNPFALKQSIIISLEVTSLILSSKKVELIHDILDKIPNELQSHTLKIPEPSQEALADCIQACSSTETYKWLRDDLREALMDFGQQFKRNVS